MFEVGRICVKLAGRDAGQKCVVVDVIDKNNVLIDGETRRRNCNISHLEPLNQKIELKKAASHEDVKKAFEKIGLTARDTTPKNAAPRPIAVRKGAEKQEANVKDAKVVKPAKKAVKKAVKAEAKENAETEEKTEKTSEKKPSVKKAKAVKKEE